LVAKVCRRAIVGLPLRVTPARCASRTIAQRTGESVIDCSMDRIRVGTALGEQEPFSDERLDLGMIATGHNSISWLNRRTAATPSRAGRAIGAVDTLPPRPASSTIGPHVPQGPSIYRRCRGAFPGRSPTWPRRPGAGIQRRAFGNNRRSAWLSA
jgi:hypothetical protein